jgi:hypothetical protein
MARIDYNKAEQVYVDGLNKMTVRNLLRYADLVGSLGTGKKNRKLSDRQQQEVMRAVILTIVEDMKGLKKKDARVFDRLKINSDEFKGIVLSESKITPQEWEKVKEIREKVKTYKKELRKKVANLSDEDLVKNNRKKQKTSRFNVEDDWIPLH